MVECDIARSSDIDTALNSSVIAKVIETTKKAIPELMKDDVRKILLFGSCASGDYTEDSDVDIAILTGSNRLEAKQYNDALAGLAADIAMDTYAVVNYVCLPYEEFEEKKSWYPFFGNIEKDGVLLYEHSTP